jgi:hypothetical protein
VQNVVVVDFRQAGKIAANSGPNSYLSHARLHAKRASHSRANLGGQFAIIRRLIHQFFDAASPIQ